VAGVRNTSHTLEFLEGVEQAVQYNTTEVFQYSQEVRTGSTDLFPFVASIVSNWIAGAGIAGLPGFNSALCNTFQAKDKEVEYILQGDACRPQF